MPELLAMGPSTTAVLETEPPAPLGGKGNARITRYDLNAVDVLVETDGPAMLLLADNWFPGWQASVNGTEQEFYRSHMTFRAVSVPAGSSAVEFRYRPLSFFGGLWAAVAALLVAIVTLFLSLRARYRVRGS